MSITHKVTAAAAFVTRRSGPGQLVYRDAPIPEDATNLDTLVDGGFVGKIGDGETVGGHPSDIPEGFVAPAFSTEPEAEVPEPEKKPARKATAAKAD